MSALENLQKLKDEGITYEPFKFNSAIHAKIKVTNNQDKPITLIYNPTTRKAKFYTNKVSTCSKPIKSVRKWMDINGGICKKTVSLKAIVATMRYTA